MTTALPLRSRQWREKQSLTSQYVITNEERVKQSLTLLRHSTQQYADAVLHEVATSPATDAVADYFFATDLH